MVVLYVVLVVVLSAFCLFLIGAGKQYPSFLLLGLLFALVYLFPGVGSHLREAVAIPFILVLCLLLLIRWPYAWADKHWSEPRQNWWKREREGDEKSS